MYNSKKGRHYRRTKETAMHSPRVAPCVPLCGLLQEGVASVYPCGAFRVVGRMWAKSEKYRKIVDNSRLRRGIARSKSVQVKGRVALKSPLARFTPPGKAVRGFLLHPKNPVSKFQVASSTESRENRSFYR